MPVHETKSLLMLVDDGYSLRTIIKNFQVWNGLQGRQWRHHTNRTAEIKNGYVT